MKKKHTSERRTKLDSDPLPPVIEKRDPRCKFFFECPKRIGGPVNPIVGFEDVYSIHKHSKKINYSEYPLYENLLKISK